MKKILWLSNARFSKEQCSCSGTWLGAMSERLAQTQDYCLYNITCVRGVTGVVHEKCDRIEQWLMPYSELDRTGLPPRWIINAILKVIDDLRPDLVHVWGLENYFGLLVARGYIKGVSLIDIQGIRHAVALFYMGNLNLAEQLSCIGIKEVLKPSVSIFGRQRYFLQTRANEIEVIGAFRHISYQSEWSRSYLSVLNATANLYKTKRMLRREFYAAKKWTRINGNQTVYVSCGATLPYKGLFVVLRAIALLMASGEFPNLQLHVAGDIGKGWLRSPGYYKWILHQVRQLHLQDKVAFLGRRTAAQMCADMGASAVFVHPSFIESYSLAVAEAMYLGVPCVVSYAGAMPELARQGESALYYPSGDHYMCAHYIRQILQSGNLSLKLSQGAIDESKSRNTFDIVLSRQMEIYHEILKP